MLIAYQMNGGELPMLNGYPVRLIVPGWYATYWVKHLTDVQVIDHVFEKFWMKPAYRIPDTACGCVEPGMAPARTVPITRMTVRSFIAAPAGGARVEVGRPTALKGIAFATVLSPLSMAFTAYNLGDDIYTETDKKLKEKHSG